MSQFDSYQPTFGQPDEKPARGKSKLLLGVLIGCGGVILLCCGGVVGMGFFLKSWATKAFEEDPAAVRDRTTAIATIDVPESLEPQVAIHITFPFVGELANVVVYGDDKQDAVLVLADVSDKVTQGQSAENFVEEIRVNAQQGTPRGGENLEDVETETVQRTIRGTDVTFKIETGKQKDSDTQRVIATGNFPGKLGEGLFMMTGNAETLTVDDVKKVIESIE